MSAIMEGIAHDVLGILGASSPADVQIRTSRTAWSRYTYEAALSSEPGHLLPIDEPTARMLLDGGALAV